MHDESGQTRSVWVQTADSPAGQPLGADARADVCIVGAGIAGMSVAYQLTKAGKAVLVLDDGPIGGGQTERTTAHLANAIDDRYFEIARIHGDEGAQLAAESHTAAIDFIETACRDDGIACDFERLDGFLFLPPGESPKLLDRELEAARRAGLVEVERLPRAPLASFDTGPCLRFPRQGQFHPLRYLAGLARAIHDRGGRICTPTHVTRVQGGRPARIETRGGPVVTADAVVVATNTPINDLVAVHSKQAPYLSYVLGARVPRGAVARGLYWDTLDPYHYVRLQQLPANANAEVLIVGGEDHHLGRADEADACYARLEEWARERFPMMEAIEFRWSGMVMETIDGLGFIGRNPLDKDNVFITTGDSGMGMTHGTIAGILITDLICGRPNRWEKLYDPSRKRVKAGMEYLKENLRVARRYTEWLTPGDVRSVDEIRPGSGAVVRRGLGKVAVFRDELGTVHELSAACPHLGCVVDWNPNEKTWDCPCHGSRFDCQGKVINGPANSDLEPVASTEPAHVS
jgi:glycine/D-amino acid oxidase-like deaminating enzyme/nitrite reductase/ring-hydroxylating ferredoxin subunit